MRALQTSASTQLHVRYIHTSALHSRYTLQLYTIGQLFPPLPQNCPFCEREVQARNRMECSGARWSYRLVLISTRVICQSITTSQTFVENPLVVKKVIAGTELHHRTCNVCGKSTIQTASVFVCSLCTTDGELVKHKSELLSGGYYVAVGFGAHFRPLDYGLHSKPAFNASPRFAPKYVLGRRPYRA